MRVGRRNGMGEREEKELGLVAGTYSPSYSKTLKPEDHSSQEFEASLGNKARSCLEKTKREMGEREKGRERGALGQGEECQELAWAVSRARVSEGTAGWNMGAKAEQAE